MAKKFYGFRFNAEQYTSFKRLTAAKSLTATQAFERFMSACLEADDLVFPNQALLDVEVEARVLSDWLEKGKRLYRKENGEEINIQGQLLSILPKLQDATQKRAIEDILKKSVAKQQ